MERQLNFTVVSILVNKMINVEEVDVKERLGLLKEIYVQTQNWARHNETLIIATNTILLGAIGAIIANYLRVNVEYSLDIFWLPLIISFIGIITTIYLSRKYRLAITRVVVYEKYFKMHEDFPRIRDLVKEYSEINAKWESAFVPEYLNHPPKFGAASSWFFLIVHTAIFGSCFFKLFSF